MLIRFRVVKASKILFVITAVILAAVLVLILLTAEGTSVKTYPAASLVQDNTAKTQRVFAVSDDAAAIFQHSKKSKNDTEIDIEILNSSDNAVTDSYSSLPRIIIYHTHTHEAYEQSTSDPYEAIEAWRTVDMDYSVVRVGKELAQSLRDNGFYVVHDTTDHELNDLATSYDRSLKTLESYKESFDLYIDLHRDAYSELVSLNHETPEGLNSAQLMLLVGNGNGFETKPNYFENHIFAKKLTQRINEMHPGICRDVLVKDGRYNQHFGAFSALVEVGHNRNSLSEALNAVQPLVDGICDIFIKHPDMLIEGIMRDYRAHR